MDNTYRILPWKKARKKGFSTVRAPKSRSVSSLEDISDGSPRSYGSTTSLPTLPFDDSTETSSDIKQASSSTDIQHQGLDSPSGTSDDKSFISEQDERLEDSMSSNDNTHDNVLNDVRKSEPKVTNSPEYEEHEESLAEIESLKSNDTLSEGLSVEPNETDSRENRREDHSIIYQGNSESDSMNYGNNIIILNNVGVENANEYDRLHPRHEDNELALLLQELDNLIGSLPEARQIGTPFSCSNFVAAQLDHRGGRIRLPEPDVCLCVPPGAIPQGQPQILYMYIVNPRIAALSDLGDEDHWLTPIVHCGPPGIQFHSYVSLSLPSSVADESNWDFTVSRGVQPEYREWESLENREDSVVLVKSGRITVLVDHFTPYGAKGKPNSGETVSKWMEAGVFIHPPCGETGEQEVQFHVRLWNISDRQRVLQEERKLLRTCLAEPIRAMRVYDSGCPVQVLVDEVRPLWVLWNHTGKTFPFQNLWREHRGPNVPDSPSITFVAQASQAHLSDWHRGSFMSTVRLFQEDHDSDGISFIVKANPDKMATKVFKEGQLRDEHGTTYLKQQSCLDTLDISTPSALFPLSEEHFHEVCLQLDGIPTEIGEKSWRAFARTANLTRRELDAIRRCAQQHRHKSPSDLLLTYFVGDPCRSFDTLRTLQEIWYVLYHIANDGAREEVEEEMYERMTAMKGRPKERQPSDISSGIDHPSELSSLVMTSDEQMSDLEDEFGKDEPLESTAIADEETLTESIADARQGTNEPVPSLNDDRDQPPNPLEEFVKSNKELSLHSENIDQEVSLSPDPSQLQEAYTDVSDDLELQLTEFSKHWAVSEDSLGSDSDLSPSSEAELLKILLADDGTSRLTENGMLSLDDPQRQATELPLDFQPIKNEQSQELEMKNLSNVNDDTKEENANGIVIYRDDGTIVDLKPKPPVAIDKEVPTSTDELMRENDNIVVSNEADKQESVRTVEEATTPDLSPEINTSNTSSQQDVSIESEVSIDLYSSSSEGHQATQDHIPDDDQISSGGIKDLPVDDEDEQKSRKEPCVNSDKDEHTPQESNASSKKVNGLRLESDNHVNGEMHLKSPGNSTRNAYQTADIEHDSTANGPHQNAKNHNDHLPSNSSSTWPLTNGAPAGISSKNGSTSLPDLDKERRSRSLKSPKRENRECLRQLARLALLGKQEDNAAAEEQTRASSTSPHPIF
ncbi:uncharacterized protein [Amphiura filiformis]|uniref:uncharacterized protein n=1 Tax=Amphiura filiformis TaxID=82378 RepID=UPI003B22582A